MGTGKERLRPGRPEGLRSDPVSADHGRSGHCPRRDRRRARLDRRGRCQRIGAAALAVRRDEEAVPRVRTERVLVRHRDQEALRRARRAREHRALHEHEAREGSEVVRRPREAGAGGEAQDEVAGRSRGPAGGDRGRVPHVPVLLRARWLRLRDEPGRQPRPVGHRRREREVPEERAGDRPLEQDRASSGRRSAATRRKNSSRRARPPTT